MLPWRFLILLPFQGERARVAVVAGQIALYRSPSVAQLRDEVAIHTLKDLQNRTPPRPCPETALAVPENDSALKRDTTLFQILSGFCRIPLKVHWNGFRTGG